MEILEKITESKFPEDCKQGEQARLIPVMDWRETHLLGFFLAALQGVPSYSRALFDLIDAPKGKTQKVDCFTEVVFRSDKTGENRVDGLIEHLANYLVALTETDLPRLMSRNGIVYLI